MKFWGWMQWIVNPAVAAAKLASQESTKQANKELLINLSQLLREAAISNLAFQSAQLYGGNTLPSYTFTSNTGTNILSTTKTKTLQEILAQAEKPA